MASIDKRPNGTYLARWRPVPGGPQSTKAFARKVDAQNFLTEIAHDLLGGRYVDPKAGRISVAAFAEEYQARRAKIWRPTTIDRVKRELALWILPTFGDRALASITRANVEVWAAGLPLSQASAGQVVKTLRAMLEAAVEDDLIPRNPATKAKTPKGAEEPVVPLTGGEVLALIDAAPADLRAAFILAAGTGLRIGEALAVTADRVDFLRRELRVDRQAATMYAGGFGPVKARRSFRTIALDDSVLGALAAHIEAYGLGPDGALFHRRGRMATRTILGAAMVDAAAAAGVSATWHDFRHHHASVLLSHGVSPALVAERLGHSLAALLSTYAHVIRSDEDRVRQIISAGFAREAAAQAEESGR